MEHPASLSPGSTWRAAALVAAAVAALELVLLVVVVIAAFAKPFASDSVGTVSMKSSGKVETAKAHEARTGGKEKPGPKRAAGKLPRTQTSVIVLNGNGISGAADQASSLVRSLRYLIAGTANAPRSDFARSLVMYRPGFQGEATRLARDVRIKRIVPLDGMRAAELQGAHVALILGRN